MDSSSKKLWAKGLGSSLPFELVEEILERIPIEDLLRSKSICKQWYALSKDKRFVYKHLDLSQDKRFIRIYRDMVQIINPVTLHLLRLPIPAEFLLGFSKYNTFISVIHCNGLLLCRCAGKMGKRKLAVWNPVLSSVKWIEPLHSYNFLDVYGFGYDNDNKYKILRFYPLGNEYEIYDFKSKLWRVFPVTLDWFTFTPLRDVSMKGNMYWIAETSSNREATFIQSFDFSKETFKPICSSLPVVRSISLDTLVLSGFGGDRLSLLHAGTREIKIEVWVTNKVTDGVVTWSKYFNVTRPDLPILLPHCRGDPTYFIHKTSGIMLWCDKVVQQKDRLVQDDDYACASFYEIGDNEIRKQVETGPQYARRNSTYICGDLYVPSLVPIPE